MPSIVGAWVISSARHGPARCLTTSPSARGSSLSSSDDPPPPPDRWCRGPLGSPNPARGPKSPQPSHRLRHSVATILVGRGRAPLAQQRPAIGPPPTTLRSFAYAMPLEDETVADEIDELLSACSRCHLSPR